MEFKSYNTAGISVIRIIRTLRQLVMIASIYNQLKIFVFPLQYFRAKNSGMSVLSP